MNIKQIYETAERLGFKSRSQKELKPKGIVGAYVVLINEFQTHNDLVQKYKETGNVKYHIEAVDLHFKMLDKLFNN